MELGAAAATVVLAAEEKLAAASSIPAERRMITESDQYSMDSGTKKISNGI